MSRRLVNAFLAAVCLAAAGCQTTGEPPVAEWSVEPSNAPPDHSPMGGGAVSRGGAVTSARGGNAALVVPGSGRFIGRSQGLKGEAPDSGEDKVTLNLANLPIAQAVKVVLGDIMSVNYVIDPRLDGKITVHTTQPVSKTAALELFESALRVSGGAVVQAGGVYKIVPLDQAGAAGGNISTAAADATSVGESTRVIQLHYVAASEMRRLLEPMAIQGGIVSADDARHTITLRGSPQDLATLGDVIATFDIDTMRGMSFALVPVKSGDPDAIVEDLRKVFGADDKDGPMKGMVRFVSNKRLASVLVISAQPAYLSRAQTWIQRLDARAQGTEKQFFTYRVQNRPAKEMLQVLTSMFGSDSRSGSNTAPRFGQSSASSSSSGDDSGQSSSSSSTSSPLGALSASGPTGGGQIGGSASSGGASSGLGGASSGGLGSQPGGPNGAAGFFGAGVTNTSSDQGSKGPGTVSLGEDGRYKVGVDEAKNSLVVMATADDYNKMLHVIEALDVQPNQVFIEATIAEVALTDELHFGVAWFLQRGRSAAGFGGQAVTSTSTTSTTSTSTTSTVNTLLGNNNISGSNLIGVPLQSVFPGFSYAFTLGSAVAVINALNAITNVNILSTPSLTVLDNRQATLQVGQEIPVNTLQSVSAIGNTFNSQSYLNTGVILAITPHISESGRLMLDINQEVSNTVPGTGGNGNNPTIDQRKVKTQVSVTDGESLVLGGLVQDQRSKSANQIPVVGDIPIVGSAFKDKDDQITKTELIIMITPHVIRNQSEARQIAEEYKRKLLSVSTKAIARPHDIEQSTRRTLLDDTAVSPWIVDRVTR
ncbi:type II secretion system secretin GspD [Methylocystis bryophila]|uniref:type II secretion system secretin GspD n=1 Tax=Methylocystis bryophila TaxID=655015 RepID=UPI001FD8ABEA|nr:type II secretion system secretin GspD [Methylocystis bryophila]